MLPCLLWHAPGFAGFGDRYLFNGDMVDRGSQARTAWRRRVICPMLSLLGCRNPPDSFCLLPGRPRAAASAEPIKQKQVDSNGCPRLNGCRSIIVHRGNHENEARAARSSSGKLERLACWIEGHECPAC